MHDMYKALLQFGLIQGLFCDAIEARKERVLWVSCVPELDILWCLFQFKVVIV